MTTSLLILKVRGQRDVVRARQYARQIARLLRFEPHEQALIAATVFEIARTVHETARGGTIHFQLNGDRLQVAPIQVRLHCLGRKPKPPASIPTWDSQGVHRLLKRLRQQPPSRDWTTLRLDQPIPPAALPIAREDLPWLVQEVTHQTPLDLFEEFLRQNQELLLAMEEMRAAPSKAKTPAA